MIESKRRNMVSFLFNSADYLTEKEVYHYIDGAKSLSYNFAKIRQLDIEKKKENIQGLAEENYYLIKRIIPDLSERLIYRHSKADFETTDCRYVFIRARIQHPSILKFALAEKSESGLSTQGLILVSVNIQKQYAWVTVLTKGFNGQADFIETGNQTIQQKRHKTNYQFNALLESILNQKSKLTWRNSPEDSEIPAFEKGNVQLTDAHLLDGITQKDIDWINHNRQGLIISFDNSNQTSYSSPEGIIGHHVSKSPIRLNMYGQVVPLEQKKLDNYTPKQE